VIAPKGTDQVTVQLPGVTDQDRAVKLIGQTAQLEFRMMDTTIGPSNIEGMVARAVEARGLGDDYSDLQLNIALADQLPEGTEVVWERKRDDLTGESNRITPFLLRKNADLTGDLLADAFVAYDQFQVPYVGINFNPEGADIFCNLTKTNTNEVMAIVLDDVVRSSPRIDEPICGGRARITLGAGNVDFLQREAADLVIVLQAGALPAPVQIEQNRTVGATLGADSVRKGVLSLAFGALLVIAFMLAYYRGGGLIANIALGTNIVLVLAALSAFGATLTLPGIAGIILTIGMAVDANIIIFERIREELRLGKSPRVAAAAGFDKAWWTIMDANITTFIAGVVLYSYGTGPLKGFAVTLMIGILTTLFSALVIARLLFTIWTERRELKRLSI
jgi:protein-export membrane protein SecD